MILQPTINLLGIDFHIYGLLIGIAMLIPIFFVERKFKSIGIADILIVVASILVGARALYVFHSMLEPGSSPMSALEAISIWDGGLALYGGVAGGALGLLWVARLRQIDFYSLASTVLTYLPLAQAVGRLGNYFNQELYGKPTALPWAISITPEKRLPGYESFSTFHPTFLYEICLNLVNFVLIYVVRWNLKEHFDYENPHIRQETARLMDRIIIGTYLINYGLIRMLLNLVRIDKEFIFGIESSDIFSVIAIALGVILIIPAALNLYSAKRSDLIKSR